MFRGVYMKKVIQTVICYYFIGISSNCITTEKLGIFADSFGSKIFSTHFIFMRVSENYNRNKNLDALLETIPVHIYLLQKSSVRSNVFIKTRNCLVCLKKNSKKFYLYCLEKSNIIKSFHSDTKEQINITTYARINI